MAKILTQHTEGETLFQNSSYLECTGCGSCHDIDPHLMLCSRYRYMGGFPYGDGPYAYKKPVAECFEGLVEDRSKDREYQIIQDWVKEHQLCPQRKREEYISERGVHVIDKRNNAQQVE